MTATEPDAEINALHREKMARRKAARDRVLATKTEERGLLIVHTGLGKGKSTAAFGMVMRCIGHGFKTGIVQFTKGKWESGERAAFAKFGDQVVIHAHGEGFTWETQDRARDIAAATKGWERAKELIRDDRHRMVLLDELNLKPILDLNMRLGEASGAATALLILRAALACHTGMATFAEAGVSDKPAEEATEKQAG